MILKDKKKYEKYLRPKNVEFLEVPKVNQPVWENLSQATRYYDKALQSIQKDFLRSSIPILSVMQKVNEAKEDLSQLDPKEIIRILSDSLGFIGSANVALANRRRMQMKKELSQNMQGLCREDSDFSGSNLFGENLNSKIKEVSELNKISKDIRGRGRGSYGGNRGRGPRNRGNYSFKHTGRENFYAIRDNPYKGSKNKGLDKRSAH